MVIAEGAKGAELFLVVRGSASVHLRQQDGGDTRLATFAAGTVLGELASGALLTPRVMCLHDGGQMEEHMATLNVKNLPDPLYRKLQARARRQRRSVAQEVIHLLTEAVKDADTRSILELRGLGKELWKGVDAGAHVDAQRRSWD